MTLEQDYAELYAVASIIYYGSKGRCTGYSDAQFDGLCHWLLEHESWKRIEWLERDMLRAGSGYDVPIFPPELHARAADQLVSPCTCLRCMCQRGEIQDPEVYARLGIPRPSR